MQGYTYNYKSFYDYMSFNWTYFLIKPKNETDGLLLSITKNCQTLMEKTHRKAEETLEIKLTKTEETFQFNPPVEGKEDWKIGLTTLEVYTFLSK